MLLTLVLDHKYSYKHKTNNIVKKKSIYLGMIKILFFLCVAKLTRGLYFIIVTVFMP